MQQKQKNEHRTEMTEYSTGKPNCPSANEVYPWSSIVLIAQH